MTRKCSTPGLIRYGNSLLFLVLVFLSLRPGLAVADQWRSYGNRYSIIVMSDGRNSDEYFWPVTNSMYEFLREMGFAKDCIRFLAPDKYLKDHPDRVFARADETGVRKACEWAQSVCTSDDLLYIFWISHGTPSEFTTAGKPVRHSILKGWLKHIKAKQIIGVYQPCSSGAVVDDLSRANVITTTSTSPVVANNWPWAENMAMALAGPPHCDRWMNPDHKYEPAKFVADQNKDGHVSVTEAYIWVARHRYTEGSMFDDNGDRIGGQWAKDTFDPADPGKDGYIGSHYSLKGWIPLPSPAK